ncbi:NADH dehydrogenase, FAD-containing subunit [Sinosporangium album]|uniref:NADH dehydrogenase, FAD-containing subunit n=1 Tax=Sinosporangium album TaxID=504805 RepID=A0A1G7U6T9_9ACTN|nr:FAD-dependent oxidoreductase [Sinosporangium album]SDG43375.1 NADH dehydrogenase, FAD-containing subunit [Sinosporangium album]
MSATVVVIGGGYGGTAAAKALDDKADVVLVEPRDAFVHNVGALRAIVKPDWMPNIFIPYDGLLAKGRVVRDRAVSVEPHQVTLASGEKLKADYVVLATGSTYPFPAKTNMDDSAAAQDKYRTAHGELAAAKRVLLLGAGPVGLEFAGEIKAEWPDKQVVIVDPVADILADFAQELREEIRSQLATLDVQLVLGSALTHEPETPIGVQGDITATTQAGTTVEADIWFRCYGVNPVTDYLAGSLAAAREANGQIKVTDTLQVEGHDTVFAIGDITTVPEAKRAGSAMRHGDVVAENIAALIAGEDKRSTYEVGEPLILLPLGPSAGASQLPGMGVVGAEVTSQYKGADLMLGRFNELLGQV